MKLSKTLIFLIVLCVHHSVVYSQEPVRQDWFSFVQSIDASFVNKKTHFRLSAYVKVVSDQESTWAGLWARVDNKGGGYGFFDNMNDRRIKSSEWRPYLLEGEVDEKSDKIYFGGLCSSNGSFYFDRMELQVENEDGYFMPVKIENAGFENKVEANRVPGWNIGIAKEENLQVKGYNVSSSDDSREGKYSLLVTGEKVEKDSSYLILPEKGATPQIGTLISMLNNLSNRVERIVGRMSQKDIDWLFDDNANSFGALVMHLAAAEAFYQVYTFEGRRFNEEEKEKWEVALNLGEEAREKFKGKDIQHYLNIFRQVRQRTIEELQKRDDDWLYQTPEESDRMNNYFCWFHVMEHQSSHLGQILMLRKRLPKEQEDILQIPLEEVK